MSLAKGLLLLAVASVPAAWAQGANPCPPQMPRALVLSGGGAKGAFEAGATYHLVVHRGCDFKDFSGVSAGALNVAYLAQAPVEGDSLANLQKRAKGLVDLWRNVRGAKQVMRGRFLAVPRLLIFGTESLKDFIPLRKLVAREVDVDALLHSGRDVRVGTVSFYDGSYREIMPNSPQLLSPAQFVDYVYASALIPVYGTMPRIQEDKDQPANSHYWSQFSDGGVRHPTPVAGYFPVCGAKTALLQQQFIRTPDTPPAPGHVDVFCDPDRPAPAAPAHRNLTQLFVVIAAPYDPASDHLPPPGCCPDPKGVRHVRNGKEVLWRTLEVVLNSPYRWDLSYALMANDALRSRADLLAWARGALDSRALNQFVREFGDEGFPVGSYHSSSDANWSLPYDIVLITPKKENGGTYQFDPANIRKQLHEGCLTADATMTGQFQAASMKAQCDADFPEEAAAPPR
ncbi:MAG: patatin-like phospholipase family protein [Acidobacteriota bacterium]|nr:patatin-like phospholipase family protein [Acidobacteriota bacterium]